MIYSVSCGLLIYNQLMRATKILSILFLCLLLAAQGASLQIYSVSYLPGSVANPAIVSLRGGAMIYLKVTGHNPMASGNKIYVGTFPCIIPSDGVSDTFVACQTTDTGLQTDIDNLPVTIISYGTSYTTTGYPNSVYFHGSKTPSLTELYPASGFAGSQINLYGIHRIRNLGDGQRDMGDVTKILLGQDICSRFDIEQPPNDNYNWYSYINCTQSHQMEAGKYNVTELLVPGTADKATFLRRSSLVPGEYFEFAALPTITAVTPNRGNIGGQNLSITGTGFSLNVQNNSVLVDGNPCSVTYSDEGTIKCTIAPKNPSLSSMLNFNSNSSNQTNASNAYFSGAGLNYARYSYTASLDNFISAVRSNNLTVMGAPQEVGFRAQLKEGDVYGSYYSQTWNGYFTAPVTGDYTFYGTSDDVFKLFLANTSATTTLPASPLIFSNGHQYWNDYYINYRPQANATVTLQQGKSYYLEAYHINWGGPGNFKIEVSVPNTDPTLSFQTYQVDQIFLSSTVQPEVLVYTMTGGSSGTFNIRIYRPALGTTEAYDVNADVIYGCTPSDFASALNKFDIFSPYAISVVRAILDSNNNIITNISIAAKITYTVSVYLVRPSTVSSQSFIYTKNTYNGNFIQPSAPTTPHSPLVSGTYSLTIGGVTIDPYGNGTLPYNTPAADIQKFLRDHIVGFQDVEVTLSYQYSCQYSCSWFIKYKNYNHQQTNVVPNTAGLSGGAGSPTIVVNTRRNYSPNVLFNPVDYRFLNTQSNSPNVMVSTNGVPSICTGSCSYTFDLFSEVTALSISGTVLSFAISDPTSKGFTASQVSVTVQGLPCVVDTTKPISGLTCQLPAINNTLALVASNNVIPTVWVGNYGIAALAPSVTGFVVPLVVNPLNVSSGGTNGGYVITITGSGFPNNNNQISITLCNALATIKTTSNTQVSFYVPSCATTNSQTLSVKVGQITDNSQSFLYTTPNGVPTVISLSPASANPGIKGVLEINGNNFGNDSSLLQVFLSNSSGKIYQLNILNATDTYLKVGLSGGLAGIFTVQVNLPGAGDSLAATVGANLFTYVVSIQSISPSSGSIYGGSLITITGQNFATAAQQTLVFIGPTINWMCSIESITSTAIQCRTPAISEDYSPGVAQPVVVTTRLIVQSQCVGSCSFTYLAATNSPTLANITQSSGTVTLIGSTFTAGTTCSVSLTNTVTNKITAFPAATCSSNTATFAVPPTVISGNYNVKVRSELGESNPLSLSVGWNAGTQSIWSGSTAGSLVTFSGGSGYPLDLTNRQFSVVIRDGSNKPSPANVISCCAGNSITILMAPAAEAAYFTINFVGPTGTFKAGDYIAYAANTGTLSLASNSTVGPGLNNITLTITKSVANPITSIVLVSQRSPLYTIPVSNWTVNGSQVIFSALLTTGTFTFQVGGVSNFYTITSVIRVSMPINIITNPTSYSYNGGLFTIAATGLSPISNIRVNSLVGRVVDYNANTSSVTYQLPALLTTLTQSTYTLATTGLIDLSTATFFSDIATGSTVGSSFDGSIQTYYSSNNNNCWIGIDFGAGLQASVGRVRFFPNINWKNTASKILNAQFQGSNDNVTWTTLTTVDQTIHSGWNTLASSSALPFRYVRFAHTTTSQCNIAEIQLYGIVYSATTIADLASKASDVVYEDGFNTVTFPANATYSSANTAIVTAFSPQYGDIFGGYPLTITGTNLNFDTPSVVIDGVVCANAVASSATTITCTVGARPNPPSSNSLIVRIGASTAILRTTFYYVLRWSDKRTWGVDLPPIDGDLVSVPAGTTLLVDQDTPKVRGIAAANATLIFSDQHDVTVNAGFITVVGGKFIAGTEESPYQHKLNFILHGDYYDTQQPMFGNKGIGCMECALSMHGKPRTPTWTTLAATVAPGATTLTLSQDIDWQVGEEIVVAATSFYHWEAERRTITAVSGRTLTVNAAFQYSHVATVETYGSSDQLPMIAEVGLLTRNIKMRGDDATSMVKEYGSHLMISGQSINGAEGHVAYTEFTQCGQPAILGRYCIHFHMNGDVPTSYVRGNAVHDSLARVVTLHAVFYLTVELNVGYRVRGHNFFVEDGIETHNTIRNNLAIGSLAASNMLATDTSVASFWVTNPTNDFYGNHAAGSDFYGIWYEIKPNPDGPSATSDVCPTGNPLGSVHDNVAHSNVRFGLRIFQLQSRLYPCSPIRDDTNGTDPWFSNPSSPARFSNFILYKNMEDGLLAEQTGNAIFQNFAIGENYRSGVEFYLANFTREPPTVINSFIVGQSRTNAASDTTNYTLGMSGAITGRSGVTQLTNIRFYNFPQGSVLFQTCRLCDDPLKYTNLGTEVILSQITLTNVTGSLLYMIGLKRDVIYDTDGSLSYAFDRRNRTSATIVYGYPHIALSNPTVCPRANSSADWDNAVMCDSSVTIRRVAFTNLGTHQDFAAQMMKATELANINDTVPQQLNATQYTSISSTLPNNPMEPKVEKPYSWGLPYITGRIYNIWWGSGVDFLHLAAFTSPNFAPTDKGIIFKFNYSANRELYNVGPIVGKAPLLAANYINETNVSLDASTCKNGDYFHDNNDNSSYRMFTLCQSGKNRSLFEYTDVNGVICKRFCPLPPGTFISENFLRYWSNATQWPGGVVPQPGDNVTVKGEWRLVLDVDPNPINNLTIDGYLIADDTRDVNIVANYIFIRSGNFTAGSPSSPFKHNLNIQLNGQKTDPTITIDPLLSGNKLFVVSGSLNLYGKPPSSVIATLTQTAFKGASAIYVDNSSGWANGDTITLAPSFSNSSEFETAVIKTINADGSITLTTPLLYTHYGDASITVNSTYGTLDTRAKVGHVNRNIKITAGPDAGWGFSIYVYGYTDTASVLRVGSVQLVGVQILNGGQLDSTNSPLVFKNLIGGNYSSLVQSTSFVNCRAFCINVDTSNNITITNNVLYNAWVFGVQVVAMKNFIFTNNVIIGISARPTVDGSTELIACFSSLFQVAATDNVKVTDNVCQGSVSHGWALAHIACNQLEINPFANNTIGTAHIGFILNKINQDCQGFSYIKAYGCDIGHIVGPPTSKSISFSNFVLADNGRGATLKMGASEGKNNHTAYFKDSYITAVSRPNCSYCYGNKATNCVTNIGVRMFTASANGEIMPGKFGTGFDVVCKQPVYNSKAYLTNIIFDNFQQSYNGTSVSSVCSNNFAFRPHSGGFDMVGGHYLTNCNCTRCDNESYVLADAPDPSMLGWFGGCGDLLCTGKQNYQIVDWTGGFLGAPGTVIGNNSVIGNNEPGCTFSKAMNGHRCNRTDFATLQYQSIAPDFNKRIMWPVNLTYDGANYTTVTNGWREWEWLGKEPQNQRFGRFVSLVSLNKTYNMTFSAVPPFSLQLQLQTRTPAGNNSNYIIVKLYYPLPNSIKLTVNNAVVKPLLLTDYNNANSLLNTLNRSQCGSNIYFYTNNTIEFVLTEAASCTAVISLVDSITLTTHFAIDINTFFSSNAITSFINNLCAMLQITDTSRVKVVGVYTGSVIVSAVIEAEQTTTSNTVSSSTPTSDPNSLAAISALLNNNINNGTFGSAMSANIGTVQTVISTPNYLTPPTTNTNTNSKSDEDSKKVPLIVGVAVGGSALTVVVILGVMWVVRKRAKVMEEMVSEESFPQQHDDKNPDIFSKPNIHPEQSNIMLRNPKTAFEVKDVQE